MHNADFFSHCFLCQVDPCDEFLAVLACSSETCPVIPLRLATSLPSGEPASLENPTDVHSRSGRDQGRCHKHDSGGWATISPSFLRVQLVTCFLFLKRPLLKKVLFKQLPVVVFQCLQALKPHQSGQGLENRPLVAK